MKILFVLEHFHPFVGGVSILFEELAKKFITAGHTVDIVTVWLPGMRTRQTWQGMTIHRVKTPPFSRRYWFTFCALPTIWRLGKKADIIQTTTYNAAPPAWLVAKLMKKPLVITVHEVWGRRWFAYPGNRLLNFFYLLVERVIVRLSYSRLIADSKATASDLLTARKKTGQIEVVYPGIDTVLFNPQAIKKDTARTEFDLDTHFWFLSYGRPGISKGIECLVEAMASLKASHQEARLLLILNDDPRDRYLAIQNLIQKHQLVEIIRILKPLPRNRLPHAIAAADCVVVPSLAEGFGFTAAEACAMGQPLITTTAGSLPEVAGGNVLFVEPASTMQLSQAMKAAMRQEYNSVPVKNFTWDKTARAYLVVYQQVIHENS